MSNKFFLSLAIFCALVGTAFSQSAVTEVDFFNNASTLLLDQNGVALSQGTANLNSDGMLIQLGYFSMGTAASNFAGTWIPITGFGTTLPRTTIGDSFDLSGAGSGRLAFVTIFRDTSNVVQVFDPLNGDTGAYTSQSSITITTTTPPSGQILAIRFYNTATGGAGSLFNTVSSDNWQWASPTDAGSNVVLNLVSANTNGTLEFQDFANPFRTTILIPEPSTYALIGLGALALIGYRCRQKATA